MRALKDLWTPTSRLYDRADEGQPRRFVLDCSIAWQNYRDDAGVFQEMDLTPEVIASGLRVRKVPYDLTLLTTGARRVAPDRAFAATRFINLPANKFLAGKTFTRVGNSLVWQSQRYDIVLRWENSRVKFDVVLKRSVPFDSVSFDVDKTGIDDTMLLSYLTNLKVTDSSPEPIVRSLSVSLVAGVLTLGFDLTGMTFPVTLDPTLDLQVGAGADDGFLADVSTEGSGGTFYSTQTLLSFGNVTDTNKRSLWVRFTGITISAPATIDVGYLTYTANLTQSATAVNSTIWGNDEAAPTAPTTAAEYWAKVKTAASAAWDGVPAWTLDVEYNTPSIVSILQELADSYTYSSGAMQFLHWNNGSTTGARRSPYSYDGSAAKAAKLHIEYTAGGGRIMGALAGHGGLAGAGGIAGRRGGIAG